MRSTASGSRTRAPSAVSAAAQSSVSAIPGALTTSAERSRCTNATTSAASDSATPGIRALTIASSRAALGYSIQA